MALKAINNSDYSSLLWKLSNLPSDDEESIECRKVLNQVKARYDNLLIELSELIDEFDKTATRIRIKSKPSKMLGFQRSASEIIDW